MRNNLFLICDKDNNIATISGIVMFGIKVDMPAIFENKEGALGILFELEESGLLKDIPHVVSKIDSKFSSSIG
jgi:hypothetical protein